MTSAPLNLLFVLEDFALESPAQQLLDRFLIGYPREGEFHQPGWAISAWWSGSAHASPDLERRRQDSGLIVVDNVEQAVSEADAVVMVWKASGERANDGLLRTVLSHARPGGRVFVHGVLAESLATGYQAKDLARRNRVELLAGTPLPVTWRLPQVDLAPGSRIREALVVVQGRSGVAEFHGLECLLPAIENRRGREAGVARLRSLEGAEVWRAGDRGDWSWDLLASALSRSSNPLGDPVTDGRTQDLVREGKVRGLAVQPRARLLDHADGLRSTLLVLEGVVNDYNFAIRRWDESTIAARIYRPPGPGDHQYSRLAHCLEPFLATGRKPWRIERSLLAAGVLEAFRLPEATQGNWIETPTLRSRNGS